MQSRDATISSAQASSIATLNLLIKKSVHETASDRPEARMLKREPLEFGRVKERIQEQRGLKQLFK